MHKKTTANKNTQIIMLIIFTIEKKLIKSKRQFQNKLENLLRNTKIPRCNTKHLKLVVVENAASCDLIRILSPSNGAAKITLCIA